MIIQPPVFFDFADIIAENGRHLLANPLTLRDGRHEMNFAGLETLAADPRARILFLCNPQNPGGRVWTADELARMGATCRRHGVLVVADELHGDIGPVAFSRRPRCSFRPLDVRRPKGFGLPMMSADGAGYRSRRCFWRRIWRRRFRRAGGIARQPARSVRTCWS